MEKRASVKDIAQELHISLSTVHKALTGKGGISEERRKEVLATAQRLGYEVNSVAQSLARKDINIGILMPSRWPDYFEGMKKGIEREIGNLKKYKVSGLFYDLTAEFTREDAQKALVWIVEKEIDALIYCPSMYYLHDEFLWAIRKAGLPIFLAGDSFEEIDSVSAIMTDSELSGRIAADFLRCVEGDQLRVAIFTGSLSVKPHKEKVDAFTARVENFGGKVQLVCATGDDSSRTYAAMEQVASTDINAIYVTTATSAPVCRYLEEHKLNKRISLICTDLFDELKYYMKKNIVKATIYQNQEKVGSMAVRSAYDYLVKKNSYGNEELEIENSVRIRPSLLLLADIE